jgi:DNA-binding transcriptional MerR regulator
MDDGDTLYSIGELARRTGLSVRAIRFYSDSGLVPPTTRNPAGYRRYDATAAARLDLVRTLRELGVDLATIRRVMATEVSLAEVAAVHADALAVRIRMLRLRRAVLTAVAARGSTPEEMALMHKLARLSEDERRQLIEEFLGTAFGGLDDRPGFDGIIRSLTPELPDDPEVEQVEAWVALAELSQDPDFRAAVREIAEHHAADRAPGELRRDPAALVRDLVGPVLAAGVDPASAAADAIVDQVTAHYGRVVGRPDGVELRRRLLTRLAAANNPEVDRYLRLLAMVNGWRAPEDLTPALGWFGQALRVRPDGGPSVERT